MRTRDPVIAFWIAVFVAVAALGLAWHASVVVAVVATLVCAVASLVAARILILYTLAAKRSR
jgi:hypothetical protein